MLQQGWVQDLVKGAENLLKFLPIAYSGVAQSEPK